MIQIEDSGVKTPRAVMDAVNTRAPIPTHARTALEVLLVILAVAAAAWVLYRLPRLLFVLALGMFFAYVVETVNGTENACRRVSG